MSEQKGVWRIVPRSSPNVLLDHAGYPVEIRKNEVRLLVDLDTGIWWVEADWMKASAPSSALGIIRHSNRTTLPRRWAVSAKQLNFVSRLKNSRLR